MPTYYMNKLLLLSILLPFLLIKTSVSQEFDKDEQYNQAMKNAKQAFEAQQFSEAVMFYREAIKIDPKARLPKYKIEDIRTIYIEKVLDSIIIESPTIEKTKRKRKKEIDAEKVLLAEKVKEEASRKMNEDADNAQKELKTLNISVIDINDDLDTLEVEKELQIDDIEGDKEVLIKKIELKPQVKLDEGKKDSATIIIIKHEIPETVLEVKRPKEETVIKEVKPEPVIAKSKPSHTNNVIPTSNVDKKIWIKEEKERLVKVYSNKKTIEEIEKPGKHITRVIMNINNEVSVYLKVKHSWGATFFFIDEVGLELKSISESYFNLKTNLKTYGY